MIEAPVNSGRNYNGPKVASASAFTITYKQVVKYNRSASNVLDMRQDATAEGIRHKPLSTVMFGSLAANVKPRIF